MFSVLISGCSYTSTTGFAQHWDLCCASFSSSASSIRFAHFLVAKTLLRLGLKHSIVFSNWATEHLPASRKSRTRTKARLRNQNWAQFQVLYVAHSEAEFIPPRTVNCTANKHTDGEVWMLKLMKVLSGIIIGLKTSCYCPLLCLSTPNL